MSWSNAAAPSAGNAYTNNGFLLRTPADANPYVFGGDSLTIASAVANDINSAIPYKGGGTAATFTINNFTVQNGGCIRSGSGETDIFRITGNSMTIGTGGANFLSQGPTTIVSAGWRPTITACLALTSGSSTFNGSVVLSGGAN